ncbi:MAG TPA: carboxypeptidase-like regulatory domain-containing protein, partial [Chitinophagaceae bacterium]|nr:carboxypeptidase-like regulatory domain-containing protein [Chitinophagaceae bacterium]
MRKLSLLLMGVMLFAAQALAQRTVSGTVTDDKGNPLPKVSVQVKGSTVGTVTKDDGSYSLVLPANATTLVFSSVDMTTQEIRITASSNYSVSLVSENKNMDEVVVVAYGTVKKEALTGSIGQVKTEQIAKRPIGNITGAIEGNVPGVITTSA